MREMTDLRKAAEMALEVLKQSLGYSNEAQARIGEAKQALRQALAQPEQEPVGYVTIETISSWAKVPSIKWFKKPTQGPLYTAPPKREWVGLTDDAVFELADTNLYDGGKNYGVLAFAKAIEQALKEKNR